MFPMRIWQAPRQALDWTVRQAVLFADGAAPAAVAAPVAAGLPAGAPAVVGCTRTLAARVEALRQQVRAKRAELEGYQSRADRLADLQMGIIGVALLFVALASNNPVLAVVVLPLYPLYRQVGLWCRRAEAKCQSAGIELHRTEGELRVAEADLEAARTALVAATSAPPAPTPPAGPAASTVRRRAVGGSDGR